MLNITINQNLVVVVFHRNHLPVLLSTALNKSDGNNIYDFTTTAEQVFRVSNGHNELESWVTSGPTKQ